MTRLAVLIMPSLMVALSCSAAFLMLLLPLVGSMEVDIEAYGCKVGARGSSFACTDAINKAIKAVSAAGGGTVHAWGPGVYVTAGIEMHSDVVFHVHAQASVNASRNLLDWTPRNMSWPPCTGEPETSVGVLGGLFYASMAHNFTIKGPGAVNGGAAAWNTIDSPLGPHGLVRSNMFVFSLCTDAVVEELQIQDSSAWTLNPKYSKRLSFRRLEITAPVSLKSLRDPRCTPTTVGPCCLNVY